MCNKQVTLTVPNDFSFLPMILDTVRHMAGLIGFEQNEIEQIELGADEAISNVIEFSFDKGENNYFELILQSVTLGMNIIIKVKGIPFDPEFIPEYSKDNLRQAYNDKGLGTFLMKQLFDEVSFNNLGKDGSETILFKHMNQQSVRHFMNQEELHNAEQEQHTQTSLPRGSVTYKIRRMKADEAVKSQNVLTAPMVIPTFMKIFIFLIDCENLIKVKVFFHLLR